MKRCPLLITLVIAFLIIDAVLVAAAIGGVRPPWLVAATNAERPAAAVTTEPTPTASASVPAGGAASTTVPVPSRLLSAFDSTTAWRATTGVCPVASDSAAKPELTTDSGAVWKTTNATASTTMTSIQNLVATGKTTLELVGLSAAECKPQFAKTFVSGDNYALYPDQLSKKWYVDPADRSQIFTPNGVVPAPCAAVVSLVSKSTAAVVMCADGQLNLTADGARTWSPAIIVAGVLSVTPSDNGYFAAVRGVADCAGIQIVYSAAGADPTATGCFTTSVTASDLSGRVAISSAGDTLWMWAGDQTVRSTDSGKTWK